MPRKKFLPIADRPYHVSARCHNKEWFNLPLSEVWNIFSDYLFFVRHAFNVRIHSFVLMNNHFHLLVSTPDANLDRAMNYLMRETSRVIGWRAGRINQVYGGPYNWSVLMSQHYYLNAYKYVYRNPVEAGLANAVENYKFSTLPGLLGAQLLVIPVEDDEILFSDANQKLAWLNESYPNEQIRLDIKNALRLREFHFPLSKDREKHILESLLV